ncbi:LysR family transcriptional regulator [Andreprevotia chitinilytica]|uniref:LysR family transcriptional regulator n=1 Tax=Andreprevotia chitinilytica TaxID=396808 RepID=UPI00054EB2EA|nr:LysR family transcriptional regulator [Andreprevotia chitinilytica]
MDIKRLRAFLTIADISHFGQAAQLLHITQPALSKQIVALEAELGGRLFERGRHGAVLTEFGRLFRDDAQRLVRDADAVLERARQAAQGERGRLAIGFGLSTLTIAPHWVAAFRQRFPEVELTLNDLSSAEQTRRLQAGQLDLGFVRLPAAEGLASLPLLEERLALAVPEQSGWTALPDEPNQLNTLAWVRLNPARGPGLAAQIAQWCDAWRVAPRIVQEADDIQTVLALVAAGIGVALLPYRSGMLLCDGVRLLPIDDAAARWQIGLAWYVGRQHAVAERFVELVRAGHP